MDELLLAKLGLIFLVGIAGGFVNTLAGGATLLTFPSLVFVGLPPQVANATNAFAIFLQSLTGTVAFYRKGVKNPGLVFRLAVPDILGAICGSYLAVELSPEIFRHVVGALMICAVVIIFFNPRRSVRDESKTISARRHVIGTVVFFFVGAYGGFFGAGMGIITLGLMTLIYRQGAIKGNAVKVGLVTLANLAGVAVFLYYGKVRFLYAIPLGLGVMLGAWISVHLALEKGELWVRKFILLVGVAAAIKIIFFF
jgi:uncharacterized membrane protein YfcA